MEKNTDSTNITNPLNSDLNAQLIEAAKKWDVPEVKRLLEAGANPSSSKYIPGTWGAHEAYSAIHFAFSLPKELEKEDSEKDDELPRYNLELYEILLKAGADLNAEKSSSSWKGADSRSSVVNMVLQLCLEKDERTLLDMAFKYGADPNKKQRQNFESMRSEGFNEKNLIHIAVARGKVNCVKSMIEAGADVNAIKRNKVSNERGHNQDSKETPLHLACTLLDSKEACKMARLLIDSGADKNKIKSYLTEEYFHISKDKQDLDPRDEDYDSGVRCVPVEETPLHIAVLSKNVSLVLLLLYKGVNRQIPYKYGEKTKTLEELVEIRDTNYYYNPLDEEEDYNYEYEEELEEDIAEEECEGEDDELDEVETEKKQNDLNQEVMESKNERPTKKDKKPKRTPEEEATRQATIQKKKEERELQKKIREENNNQRAEEINKKLRKVINLEWSSEVHKYYPEKLKEKLTCVFHSILKKRPAIKKEIIYIIFSNICAIWKEI